MITIDHKSFLKIIYKNMVHDYTDHFVVIFL